MPRIARIVALNYPHHVVQRGNNKQSIFYDDSDRWAYLSILKKYASECGCKINAYCLMLNHVHLLLIPLYEYAPSKMMQKLSLIYTQSINAKYKRTGRLWECRYYSSLVEKDSYLWTVCRYIERNPVRAKIVDRPMQYKWSSAGERARMQVRYKLAEFLWSNDSEREAYTTFLNSPEKEDEIEAIRRSTMKGTFIGSTDFVKQISEKLSITLTSRPRGRPKRQK